MFDRALPSQQVRVQSQQQRRRFSVSIVNLEQVNVDWVNKPQVQPGIKNMETEFVKYAITAQMQSFAEVLQNRCF